MSKLNPYIRIVEAAKEGKGVVLTREEVFYLAQDDAIANVAISTRDFDERVENGSYYVDKYGFVEKD